MSLSVERRYSPEEVVKELLLPEDELFLFSSGRLGLTITAQESSAKIEGSNSWGETTTVISLEKHSGKAPYWRIHLYDRDGNQMFYRKLEGKEVEICFDRHTGAAYPKAYDKIDFSESQYVSVIFG